MVKNEVTSGNISGEKIEYEDGIGCAVWNKEFGFCFDFDYEEIDDIIRVLTKLKNIKAVKYED